MICCLSGRFCPVIGSSDPLLGALRPEQVSSTQVQIRKREVHGKPMRIFRKAAISNFCKTKDPLENVENVLDARAHTRFRSIRFALLFGKILGTRGMRLREVSGARCFFANRPGLTAVRRIAPHARFVPVQQVRQNAAVVHVRRRRNERMNEAALAVDADVRLHPEVPFVAFFRLMHFWITFAAAVLGRAGRFNNRRIDDRTGADFYLTASEKLIDFAQNHRTQVILLEQMTELTNGRFIGNRCITQVNAGKRSHRDHVVKRFFNAGITQVEPLLKKVDAQHALQRNRRSAAFARWIMRCDQRTQALPRHDRVHLIEENRAFRLSRVTLKTRVGKGHLLFTLHSYNYSRRATILEGAKSSKTNQMARSRRSLDKLGMTGFLFGLSPFTQGKPEVRGSIVVHGT